MIDLSSERSNSSRSIDVEYTIKNQDLIQELVNHYIYGASNPDWANLQVALYDYGYTIGEVYNILRDVRDGAF